MRGAAAPRGLRVLDAGCGRNLHLGYPGLELRNAHVTGIDICRAALDDHPRLDVRILGDLETYPLPADTFDVVICQDVLEHLPRPKLALQNMARALRHGGEILIAWPNPASLKGLVTKFTPLRFHVWVYKQGWFGYRYQGPDGPPFKTYLRWSLRPAWLKRSLEGLGFERIRLEVHEHPAFGRLPRFARLSECRARAIKSQTAGVRAPSPRAQSLSGSGREVA